MARVPSISQVGTVRPDIDRAGAARERAALRNAARAREARDRAATEAFGAAFDLVGTLRKERQEAEDRAFENKAATEARKRFPELFGEVPKEILKEVPKGPEDILQLPGGRLDELSEALIDEGLRGGGRASPEAVEGARTRLKKLQASVLAQAAVFENNARVEEMTRDLDRNLGDLALFASDDPSLLPELLQEADILAAGAETLLPAEAIAARRQAARKTIIEATVKSVIERDPELAAEMLEAGDFDESLEAERKAVFIVSAETAMRLEKESASRELAADRRELKRDADAAIAKLRGGRQAPEATALKSRAEALEDGETLTALRHAEDDRFFMKGFARRPPAEQAALIATMEDGPELKPVETRRLAAMQAQAAVTERALARDPLAYAQSSGVIEEPVEITDLSPEALRARLRQAETAVEQFGLSTLPLLRPGEAEKIADGLAKGTPEDIQARAEELSELPVEVRQLVVKDLGLQLSLLVRKALEQKLIDPEVGQASSFQNDLGPQGPKAVRSGDVQRPTSPPDQEKLFRDLRVFVEKGGDITEAWNRMRELGLVPGKFGPAPDPDQYDEIRADVRDDGLIEIVGVRDEKEIPLGTFGKKQPVNTAALRIQSLSEDSVFHDLTPAPTTGPVNRLSEEELKERRKAQELELLRLRDKFRQEELELIESLSRPELFLRRVDDLARLIADDASFGQANRLSALMRTLLGEGSFRENLQREIARNETIPDELRVLKSFIEIFIGTSKLRKMLDQGARGERQLLR